MSKYHIIRIPKAGSGTLVFALRNAATRHEHEYSLTKVPDGDIGIACVRDPVDRFRSAFDMYTQNNRYNVRDYTVDTFAAEMLQRERANFEKWGSAFWPQTWWLQSAEYVRERGAIVLWLPTLSEQLTELQEQLPDIRLASTNEAPWLHRTGNPSVISPEAAAIVREFYADDYALLDGLGYGG